MENVKSGKSNICTVYKLIAVLFFTIGFAGCSVSDQKRNPVVIAQYEIPPDAININTATSAELEKIPFIGAQLSAKIVEHRTRNGRFRKPEHLMLIGGISDKRFRQIRHLVKVD